MNRSFYLTRLLRRNRTCNEHSTNRTRYQPGAASYLHMFFCLSIKLLLYFYFISILFLFNLYIISILFFFLFIKCYSILLYIFYSLFLSIFIAMDRDGFIVYDFGRATIPREPRTYEKLWENLFAIEIIETTGNRFNSRISVHRFVSVQKFPIELR